MAYLADRRPDVGDLLLLDLDGTIADITTNPDAAVIDEGAKRALAVLAAADPAGLVIVTGRSLADAERMLCPVELPMLASHGAEVRVPGVGMPKNVVGIDNVRDTLEGLATRFPGVWVEWKPFSAAMHFRGAPDVEVGVRLALDAFVRACPAYRIQAGRMVFEVVPAGVSKASAVEWLLETPRFEARRAIYVGDDSADEAAMAVVLARGGIALRVAGEHFDPSVSQFDDAAAVRVWLSGMAEVLGRDADGAGQPLAPPIRCIAGY